jgi:hypothetical protein
VASYRRATSTTTADEFGKGDKSKLENGVYEPLREANLIDLRLASASR